MENLEDQQTKSKYFTLIFCFKKTKKNLGKAPPLDTWRQVNMRTRNLSESHNVRNRQRQFARQYDKIKFLNAVVSFIHWIKLFPDSLQHLVAVVGDFWMSEPFLLKVRPFDRSRPLLKRRHNSSSGLSVKTQEPTVRASHHPFSGDNQLFHVQIDH